MVRVPIRRHARRGGNRTDAFHEAVEINVPFLSMVTTWLTKAALL